MNLVSNAAAHPLPRFLFVDVNRRCNMRCQHRMYWKAAATDRSNYISIARRNEILDEFAGLNRQGAVVICGGETMLDPSEERHCADRC